jgi:hypothetical protein
MTQIKMKDLTVGVFPKKKDLASAAFYQRVVQAYIIISLDVINSWIR